MEYRKDIQILRGVAVLLVVLFHLNIPGIGSGFLGVDVFFVISGYLMARLYDPSSKRDFFIKRSRRLLPAYFTTIILTLAAGVFVTTPSDFAQISDQALFATAFSSNIGFWLENSYFDKAAFKPLLHLWSLGVEIQFYLLIPILFWIIRSARASYLVLVVGSVLLCSYAVTISPKTAFFLLPFRLWEFLIGFGVAHYIHRDKPGKMTEGTAWIGAAAFLAILCIPAAQINGDALGFVHGHPGLAALAVTLATATTLSFGLPRVVEANVVGRLLEKVGNYSYSLYLAHFPVIVLTLYRPFTGTVLKASSIGQTAMLAVLSAAASVLLFHLVERPGRASKWALRWVAVAVGGVLLIGAGGPVVQKMLIPQQEMVIYQAWFDRGGYRCPKLGRILHPHAISCEITAPNAAPSHRVLLVGNSHADSIKATFSAAAQAKNVSVHFLVPNNPLMAGGLRPAEVVAEARRLKVDAIVLHYSPGAIADTVISEMAALAEQNQLRLSFIMPVPGWRDHVPMMLLNHLKNGGELLVQSMNDYRENNKRLEETLSAAAYDKFKAYQVADVLCNEGYCRLATDDGKPLYFDGGHLTLTGSGMLRKVFDRVMEDLS